MKKQYSRSNPQVTHNDEAWNMRDAEELEAIAKAFSKTSAKTKVACAQFVKEHGYKFEACKSAFQIERLHDQLYAKAGRLERKLVDNLANNAFARLGYAESFYAYPRKVATA